MDFNKIVSFLKKSSEVIIALGVFFGLLVAVVKYSVNDLYKKIDTIENNHIYHLGLDLKENKKEHESFIQEIKEMRKEITEIKSDVSKIVGQQEIIINLLKEKK
jgi:predicted PurR-regulated permease PerM